MAPLAIGTAQFGIPYGVANRSGQVRPEAVDAILARAAQAGIDTLDTAAAYGESEQCLGRVGVAGWRIVTKLPPLPADVQEVERWVGARVAESLAKLRITRLEALLLHRPRDLLGAHGEAYRRALADVKSAGQARSIGVSIYDPVELEELWDVWRPEIVQAPFNVLDRRLERSGWLAKLGRHSVRVHARSAFLQGLLLMSPDSRHAFFAPWRDVLDGWTRWCRESGLSPLAAALGFVRAQRGIERVVVGVDSIEQLDEILAAVTPTYTEPPLDLATELRDLIEPARWKLN